MQLIVMLVMTLGLYLVRKSLTKILGIYIIKEQKEIQFKKDRTSFIALLIYYLAYFGIAYLLAGWIINL